MVQVECKSCSNSYPGLCGPFDDGCNGTITCQCPSDKPFCHQDSLLRGIGAPGYCSDKPIDPTDTVVVSIAKTGPLSPVTIGDEFDFILAARVEQGLQGAKGVVVTDTLPRGLELVAVDPGKIVAGNDSTNLQQVDNINMPEAYCQGSCMLQCSLSHNQAPPAHMSAECL